MASWIAVGCTKKSNHHVWERIWDTRPFCFSPFWIETLCHISLSNTIIPQSLSNCWLINILKCDTYTTTRLNVDFELLADIFIEVIEIGNKNTECNQFHSVKPSVFVWHEEVAALLRDNTSGWVHPPFTAALKCLSAFIYTVTFGGGYILFWACLQTAPYQISNVLWPWNTASSCFCCLFQQIKWYMWRNIAVCHNHNVTAFYSEYGAKFIWQSQNML